MTRLSTIAILAMALGFARTARAEDAPAPPPARTAEARDTSAGPAVAPVAPVDRAAQAGAPAANKDAVRLRASHRVDVIAPGERIESVIDRMRANRAPAPNTDARPGPTAPPTRPTDLRRPGDRGGGPRDRHGGRDTGGGRQQLREDGPAPDHTRR